jgi:hypothetical protein
MVQRRVRREGSTVWATLKLQPIAVKELAGSPYTVVLSKQAWVVKP